MAVIAEATYSGDTIRLALTFPMATPNPIIFYLARESGDFASVYAEDAAPSETSTSVAKWPAYWGIKSDGTYHFKGSANGVESNIASFEIEDIPLSFVTARHETYDPDAVYGYSVSEGAWGWWNPEEFDISGGGRYKNNIVVVGRKKIYFGAG